MLNLTNLSDFEPYKFVPTSVDAAVPRKLLDKEVARQLPAYWVVGTSPRSLSVEAYRLVELEKALTLCRLLRRSGTHALLFHGRRLPLVQSESAITAAGPLDEYVVEFSEVERDLGRLDHESAVEAEKLMDARYLSELKDGITDGQLFTPKLVAQAQEIVKSWKLSKEEDFSI